MAVRLLPITCRGYAEFVLERPAEMREVFEATIQGNLRNVPFGILEQHGRVFQPLMQQPLAGRLVIVPAEVAFEGGQTAMGQPRELFQGEVATEIRLHDLRQRRRIALEQ